MAETKITQRPEFRSTRAPQGVQVVARPVNTGAHIRPAEDSQLTGLMDGLKAFNPALEKFTQVREQEQLLRDREANKAGKAVGDAAAQRATVGALPLDLTPMPETGLSGTAASVAKDAFRQGITLRTAEQLKEDAQAKFNEQKDLPDFDVNAFLAETRRDALAGLDDDMAATMGEALVSFEGTVRKDYERGRLERLNEGREANISAALRQGITLENADGFVDSYRATLLPFIKGQGKTSSEGSQYLLNHLAALSEKAGGRPELFDALTTEKDETGKTIADYNPSLVPRIQAARSAALQQRERGLGEAAMEGNAIVLKQLDERVAADPYSVTFDDLLGNLGRHAPFTSDNEVMTYWRQVLKARGEKSGEQNLLGLARVGQLYMAEEKDQKAIMGSLTASVVSGLSDAVSNGDTGGVAALADALVTAHRTAGSTVASGPIERMFKFIGSGAPLGDSPPPVFKAAAEVYRRLEASPQLRDVYFDEPSRKVIASYLQAVDAQAEAGTAYKGAYAAVSPEAQRRAEAFKQTPEYREKLTKATRWVTGSSFVPRFLGGDGRPENGGQLVAEAQDFALEFLKRNPQATDDEVQAQTEAWMGRSFVLDATSGVAIKVPQGIAPEAAHKALGEYTGKLSKELRLGDRGEGWGLLLLPANINQGTYRVTTSFNGAPVHMVGDVKISDLVEQHRRATLWLPDDAAQLKEAALSITSHKPVDMGALGPVLAKARQLKVQPELVKQLEAFEVKSATDLLSARPKLDSIPDAASLFRDDRKVKADSGQTGASAQRLLNTANGGDTGLAASLITMGEGVMLKAYDDPAKGAGRNIGMGYNLNANKATAERDLRAAGVKPERIQGVLAGTDSLSPEQAERLLVLSVGRHSQRAQEQVNSAHPRLWEKLQPQQRAVLTDIAYQTGDVGQFKKALAALVSGDIGAFKEAAKVHYTNRKGEKVEDKRRNALRDSMLAGPTYWQAVLAQSGPQQ